MKVEIVDVELRNLAKRVEYHAKCYDDMINDKWEDKGVIFMLVSNSDGHIVVLRFGESFVRPEVPIGDYKNGHLESLNDTPVVYTDPRDMNMVQGKTLICTKDTTTMLLFMPELPPEEEMPVLMNAMVDVLNDMGVPASIKSGQDIILEDAKIGCNAFTAMEQYGKHRNVEKAHITFYYDEPIFRALLPDVEFFRETSRDKTNKGITGIVNKYPDFDREEFVNRLIQRVAEKLGEEIESDLNG